MFILNKRRTLRKGKPAKTEIMLVFSLILISAFFFAIRHKNGRDLPSDFRDAPATYEELQNIIPAAQRPEIPFPAVSGQIQTGRPLASIRELKIATYNLSGLKRRKGKPELQLKESAAALSGAAPDIIVLQKVEDVRVLERFNSGYLNGGYAPFLEPGNDEDGNVAFLVKKDLPFRIEQRTHKNEMWRDPDGRDTPLFSRDLPALIARAEGSDKPLFILFGTHYKSTRTISAGDPGCGLLRAAQIERTSEIITRYQREFGPGAPILLAGDFNSDLHHEKAFNALWRTAGLTDSFDLLARPPPASERGTRAVFQENGPSGSGQIDGVLVSSALYSSVRNAEVYRYKNDREAGKRPPAGYQESEQNQSEHYPVVVSARAALT